MVTDSEKFQLIKEALKRTSSISLIANQPIDKHFDVVDNKIIFWYDDKYHSTQCVAMDKEDVAALCDPIEQNYLSILQKVV